MSNFARWEQESRQPLGPLQPDIPPQDPSRRFEETMEVDMSALLGEERAAGAPQADSTALHEIAEIQTLLAAEPPADDPVAQAELDEEPYDDQEPYDDDEESYDVERADVERADVERDDDEEHDDDAAHANRTAAARATLREAGQRAGGRITDARRSLTTTGRCLGRWVASLDRRPEFSAHHGHDPIAQLGSGEPRAFAHGADRHSEAAYIEQLEAELAELRSRGAGGNPIEPPISITEEIERIGEETASILVVAHDKAHETARRAQEQAERRVRDADARAEAIVAEAQRRLRQLDDETDAVWRERERLLDDVRTVCASLHALIDDAGRRFPDDPEPMAGPETADTTSDGGAVEAGATAEH